MPINRAPFNALVDDTGTGLTGSIWNKAAIQSVLLDPIDVLPWTYVDVGTIGQPGADWDPGIVGNTIVRLSMSASITIYGMKPAAALYPGQRVVLHAVSDPASILSLYHEHGAPSPGCFLHCRKQPVVAINGYWAWVEFQWAPGGWIMGGYGSGIGGA